MCGCVCFSAGNHFFTDNSKSEHFRAYFSLLMCSLSLICTYPEVTHAFIKMKCNWTWRLAEISYQPNLEDLSFKLGIYSFIGISTYFISTIIS